MTKPLSIRSVVVCSALVAIVGCSGSKKSGSTPEAAGAAGAPAADQVLASYNGKQVTYRDVEAAAGEQLAKLEDQRYELIRRAVDRVVIDALVEVEAKAAGSATPDEWIRKQLEGKVAPPSDADVQAFYEQNKAQMPPGSSFDQMRQQIVEFMQQGQQQKLVSELFDGMKKKANFQLVLKKPAKARKVVEATGPSRGPADAKVTIVEFSDFECPFCGRAHDTVEEVMQAYAGKVKLVFRQFPLEFHPHAKKAAEAALCANDQGKFWEYHSTLFKNQQKLEEADLSSHASQLGLDAAAFGECLKSGKHAAAIEADTAAGKKVGVSGTPAFFINGVMLSGAQPLEKFKELIDEELAAK